MSQMIYNITLIKRDNLLKFIWLSKNWSIWLGQLPTPIFAWIVCCGFIPPVGAVIVVVIANYY